MGKLDVEIAAYERMQEYLETNHHLEWAIIHKEELIGTYQDFQDAAKVAVKRFGRGPYLIRQIGAPPRMLPASVWSRRVSENKSVPNKEVSVGKLDVEIAAYELIQEELEAKHFGQWAVVHGEDLAGTYGDFQEAAKAAVKRFGRGPYLIRQIGAPPIVLPRYLVERQYYANR